MAMSQAEIDDLLERLLALTEDQGPEAQRDRLARLVLLLAVRLDDAAAVHGALDDLLAAEGRTLTLAIP